MSNLPHPLRQFRGNPYFFLGERPRVEAELRSYIVREHRLGRRIGEITKDPRVSELAPSVRHKALYEPETVAAIAADVREAIRSYSPSSPPHEGR